VDILGLVQKNSLRLLTEVSPSVSGVPGDLEILSLPGAPDSGSSFSLSTAHGGRANTPSRRLISWPGIGAQCGHAKMLALVRSSRAHLVSSQ